MMSSTTAPVIHVNLTCDALVQASIDRKEGILTDRGAVAVTTGKRTGRSPLDRFIVQDESINADIHWGEVNRPISLSAFETLWDEAHAYIEERESFVGEMFVGADPDYTVPVKVRTEYAWHQLFARHLFIDDENFEVKEGRQWQILSVPGLKTDPKRHQTHDDGAVMIDIARQRILLCGMRYAGEMKKAMFSIQNFLLPMQDVLPMHCSANQGESLDVALFFGLSGTGKTTLSADPKRALIGDDEHGWSKDGVFNLEGGCYAKCIDLSAEHEPVIYQALYGPAVLENVVIDPSSGVPDFNDAALTQNTRAAYPRTHIPGRVMSNQGGVPQAVIFLCCDLYGVLPPVALLSNNQAGYYFLSGYTALVGSTEVGSTEAVKPTFSCCFGEPFFPRAPHVYADLLMKRLQESQCPVYLVNTGWTGGAYGQGGKRFPIPVTRQIIDAILDQSIRQAPMVTMPGFDFQVPQVLGDIDADVLMPFVKGMNNDQYRSMHQQLIEKFQQNFKKFTVVDAILNAGPNGLSEQEG